MIENMTLKNSRLFVVIAEKRRLFAAFIRNFIEAHKIILIRCAVIFLAVKIGLILLATMSAVVFFAGTATRQLYEEMTMSQALLLSTPLTFIMMFKVYFIFRMLMSHGRSRKAVVAVLHALLLKGERGLRQVENPLPVVMPPLSPEMAVKRLRSRSFETR